MYYGREQIAVGTTVYSSDGSKLGKVIKCGDTRFAIEKGIFFPKDYLVSYDQIARTDSEGIYLLLTKDSLREWTETEQAAPGSTSGTEAPGRATTSTTGLGAKEEVRVPVVEEELDIRRRTAETGAARVRKDVITEHKQVTVPVTREEVHVERVPASGRTAATTDAAAFKEGTVTVPIREEEVEIRKRPVVKEEVRISKEARQEERTVDENLRKERVEVNEDAPRRSPTTEPGIHASGWNKKG